MTLSDSWDTPLSNPNNRRSSVFIAGASYLTFSHAFLLADVKMDFTRYFIVSGDSLSSTTPSTNFLIRSLVIIWSGLALELVTKSIIFLLKDNGKQLFAQRGPQFSAVSVKWFNR